MEDNISRERFIRLGALLGVSAASASALAACGGGSGSGSSGSAGSDNGGSGGNSGGASGGDAANSESSQASSGDQASGGQAIARSSEVRAGSAVKFRDGGQPAVLVHLESGDFVAYSAVCTHQGCTVAYRNGQLACPCHGSVFDPANGGEVVSPPAQRPLQEIPVRVRGGEVFRA